MDCRKARRALDDVRRNKKGQTPASLAHAAETVGYSIARKRGKGSHWMAIDGSGPSFPIPTRRDPVARGMVSKILAILEEALDRNCPGD